MSKKTIPPYSEEQLEILASDMKMKEIVAHPLFKGRTYQSIANKRWRMNPLVVEYEKIAKLDYQRTIKGRTYFKGDNLAECSDNCIQCDVCDQTCETKLVRKLEAIN